MPVVGASASTSGAACRRLNFIVVCPGSLYDQCVDFADPGIGRQGALVTTNSQPPIAGLATDRCAPTLEGDVQLTILPGASIKECAATTARAAGGNSDVRQQ